MWDTKKHWMARSILVSHMVTVTTSRSVKARPNKAMFVHACCQPMRRVSMRLNGDEPSGTCVTRLRSIAPHTDDRAEKHSYPLREVRHSANKTAIVETRSPLEKLYNVPTKWVKKILARLVLLATVFAKTNDTLGKSVFLNSKNFPIMILYNNIVRLCNMHMYYNIYFDIFKLGLNV